VTPLAHRILANSLKPVKDRLPVQDDGGYLKDMAAVVCFEVSAIMPLINWQCAKMRTTKAAWPTAFLPAERTFLEFTETSGHRTGLLLTARNGDITDFDISIVAGSADGFGKATIGFYESGMTEPLVLENKTSAYERDVVARVVMLLLSAINAPKVFARVEHDPHAGLARKLAASKAMPGKYPLHAWHEIKLEGWMPKVERGMRRAKGATGEKAQHFVRAHPRFQNGKWVIVVPHKRGNPQLGMRRARYSVQMPISTP
jgi:hypothetical protein